ncbi:MAG: hypothetical protein GWP63_03255 [Haliea sp.]|jgi:hypothetical protein|nr:hypothetical protein [Haliea sp.]
MTEADLLEHLLSNGDLLWSQMQYWTSVSFGVLIAAHLAAKRLSWIILIGFVVLYTIFSSYIGQLVKLNLETIKGIGADLNLLAESGVALSNTSLSFLEHFPLLNETVVGQLVRSILGYGLLIITIGYTLYCKFKSEE